IAGEPQALECLLAQLAAQQVFCRPIQVDVASHSPQMEGLAPALAAALDGLRPQVGHTPLYSTVEPRVLDGHELDGGYWMRNLRQPVQFGAAIARLAADGVTLFVELSPHPLLLGAIASGLRERGQAGVGLAALRREADAHTTLLEGLAVLYTQGYPLDWARLFPH